MVEEELTATWRSWVWASRASRRSVRRPRAAPGRRHREGFHAQQRSSQYCYLNGKLTGHLRPAPPTFEAIIKEEFQECASITNYNIVRKFVLGDAEAMDWWIEGADCEILENYEMSMDPSADVPNGVSCMSDPTIDWGERAAGRFPNA